MLPTKHHLIKYLRRWHRRLGIIVALFAILLSTTGLLLNHTEELALDSSYVRSDALLDWYGISPPGKPLSYAAGGHWISQLGERLYFDEHELAVDAPGRLLGAVALADRVVVAIEGHLMLFDLSGELLETLGGAQGAPAGARLIGVKDETLVVRASHGDYLADKDLLKWEEGEKEGRAPAPVDAYWAEPGTLPRGLHDQLIEAYRGKGLSLERVLLDLHSGRIMGGAGIVAVDIGAILFLLLAVSGIIMWLRHLKQSHY